MLDPQIVWNNAKTLAQEAVTEAFGRLPGTDDQAREEFAVQYVLTRLEEVDTLIPVIGLYMDLPIVNALEKVAVSQVTHIAVRLLVHQQLAAHQLAQVAA